MKLITKKKTRQIFLYAVQIHVIGVIYNVRVFGHQR